jgi:hypothetical protein
MTCIVGIESGGLVYLGADSAASNTYAELQVADPKVFKNQEFVIGYTTSFRFGQLLQYAFKPPKRDESKTDIEYLVTDFINSLRTCLKDAGYASKDHEVEKGGDCLIGYRGRLYTVESDYQVRRDMNGIGAVGIGALAALGALSVLKKTKSPPIKILEQALVASESVTAMVRGPFKFINTEKRSLKPCKN